MKEFFAIFARANMKGVVRMEDEKFCNYCHNNEDNHYCEHLLSEWIKFNNTPVAYLGSTICNGDQLNIFLCPAGDNVDSIVDKKITISYCPMCGRKLEKHYDDEDDEYYD